jgi:hypothetical protein
LHPTSLGLGEPSCAVFAGPVFFFFFFFIFIFFVLCARAAAGKGEAFLDGRNAR